MIDANALKSECQIPDCPRSSSRFDALGLLGFLLTLAKLPSAGVIAYASIRHWTVVVAVVALVAIPLDVFDGVLFRRSKSAKSSYFGTVRRLADSILDRLLIVTALVSATLFLGFPLYLLVLVVAREFLISAVFLFRLFWLQRLTEGNVLSKASTALIAVIGAWFVCGGPGIAYLALLFGVLTVGSVCLHIFRPRYFQQDISQQDQRQERQVPLATVLKMKN